MIDPQTLLTSCQQLAVTWVDTLELGSRVLTIGILLAALLKISATIYLTWHRQQQLQPIPTAQLPATARQLLQTLTFPLNRVLVTQDHNHEAFTIGFLKPHIVLSTQLVASTSPAELEAVLLHEHFHAAHYHPLLLTAASTTAQLLFFIPILQQFSEQLDEYCEQAADRYAAGYQNTEHHLLGALQRILTSASPTLGQVAFTARSLSGRITALREQRFVFQPFPLVKAGLSGAILIGLFVVNSSEQQIRANISPEMQHAANQQQCNFLQCASQCISTATTFSPHVSQSRL